MNNLRGSTNVAIWYAIYDEANKYLQMDVSKNNQTIGRQMDNSQESYQIINGVVTHLYSSIIRVSRQDLLDEMSFQGVTNPDGYIIPDE
jgi:hypothetical protein